MKIYTIKDIARLAGVGISTVSRVLNNRPDVSEATKKKVTDVVEMYNYTPNNNAKNLKQRNADLVSLIVRGRENMFLNDIAERIIENGNRRGQNFVLDFMDESGGEFGAARHHIAERKVRAIIFLGSNTVGHEGEIAALRVPCVFTTVDTSQLGVPAVSSVSVDNRQSARVAIDHLIDNGHRSIAVFGGIREMNDSIGHRYQGVVQSFAAHGMTFDERRYVQCSFGMEKAYRTASRFIEQTRDFTAVFAMSDVMAIGIIKALADKGLRVPEDVSVVGFDGIPLSRYTLPTLTTVEQPAHELARHSVDLALRLTENSDDTESITVLSALREGGSVRSIC